MTKYHMTQKEMLKDLLFTYVRKIRMNILMSVKDLDKLEDEIEERFKEKKDN